MKPFQKSYLPASEIQKHIEVLLQQWKKGTPSVLEDFPAADEVAARAAITTHMHEIMTEDIWINDLYQVNIRKVQEHVVHLSIKRRDKEPIHDWRHLQEIKTKLVGPECEAIELYPAESRVVDGANQFHLWACTDPTFRFPIGWNQGRRVHDEQWGSSKQRPLEKGKK